MSLVAIDVGASSSKYCSDSGIISVLPNNMVYLSEDMQTSSITSDAEDIESNLEVQIKRNGEDTGANYFPANVLVGIMAEKHKSVNERPQVGDHKHKQRINYISIVIATAVSVINNNIEDPINLYMATPPIELEKAKVEFKKHLVGDYEVTFPKYKGGTTVKFTIADVDCSPESLMACTSFFFNVGTMTPKKSALGLMKGTVVSLDIGASSTDLSIIKNGQFLDKTGQTYKTGGNVLRDNVANRLCEIYGFTVPVDVADKAIAEGRLQIGNDYEDISEVLNEAKQEFAKSITVNLPTYFNRVGIPIQTINAILVSGGGSMPSQYAAENGDIVQTSESMSHYITEELKEYAKSINVIQYGGEARFANIKGLYLKAKVQEQKKSKTAE